MSTGKTIQSNEKSLSQLIEYYALCNRAEGKSLATIRWYTGNLRRFCRYVQGIHLSEWVDDIDLKLLRQFILHLAASNKYERHPFTPAKTEHLSAAAVHGHVRTLRAFFSWTVSEGIIEDNVARELKLPKLPQKIVTTLSDNEIRLILAALPNMISCNARDQTIFMVLVDTGLRSGELVNLKMEDLHLKEGYLKVIGKSNKERVVPIGSSAQKVIQRYLFRYRKQPARPGVENVFLSIYGEPLTENSIKLIFKRIARRSGVRRLHAHLCRHTFATRFLINGGDVFALQQILGHSTLDMVKRYVNFASSQVVIQHHRFSPLDHFNLPKR